MKHLLSVALILCAVSAVAKDEPGEMTVVDNAVNRYVSTYTVPPGPQRTKCNTWPTAGGLSTDCSTTQDPGYTGSVEHYSVHIYVIINRVRGEVRPIVEPHLLLFCSGSWRCGGLDPGRYDIEYSLKKGQWNKVKVLDASGDGKRVKREYHVVDEW